MNKNLFLSLTMLMLGLANTLAHARIFYAYDEWNLPEAVTMHGQLIQEVLKQIGKSAEKLNSKYDLNKVNEQDIVLYLTSAPTQRLALASPQWFDSIRQKINNVIVVTFRYGSDWDNFELDKPGFASGVNLGSNNEMPGFPRFLYMEDPIRLVLGHQKALANLELLKKLLNSVVVPDENKIAQGIFNSFRIDLQTLNLQKLTPQNRQKAQQILNILGGSSAGPASGKEK